MPRGGVRTRLTDDEKEKIRSLLKSGMTTDQICDATGRSCVTVSRIRNELKYEGFDIWHRPGALSQYTPVANNRTEKEEEITDDIPDTIEIPDIPEIPATIEEPVKHEEETVKDTGAIEIVKKLAKFNGRKTGYGYIATSENDYLTIRNDGQEFKIEVNNLEPFVDELIDIIEEVKKFRLSL